MREQKSALVSLFAATCLIAGTLIAAVFAPPAVLAAPPTVLAAAGPAPRAAAADTAVTTFKNDAERDGQFASETILNQSNVNVTQFGKRVQYPVDGQVYAQPLFLPNLSINGGTHNVVFAATENDSVYAFDADATSAIAPLWKVSLLPAGATAVSSSVSGCGDLTPAIGITGTPVIDSSTGTLFVVSYDDEGGTLVYRLHALNVLTGADKWPAIVISGSVPGTGAGSSGGTVSFSPAVNRQRANLLLENGKVYVGFSSFCDIGAYHGWILSYSYSTTAFTLANVYTDTPNGSDGGIWSGSGGAIAGDPSGNVYYTSGNGTFDASTGGPDYGDSFVRLNGSLQVQDYFTPYNQLCLSQGDVDLGSGGLLVIPSASAVISAGKEGRVYVDSTTSMGKYTADSSLVCGGTDSTSTTIDKVQQELPPGTVGSLFSTPAIWTGPNGVQDIYFTQVNGPTRAFGWSGGKLSAAPTSTSSANGGDPVVSSNGTTPGTAIVWNQDFGGELHAYDPANLTHEFWNSNMNASRDGLPGEVKYATPAVANGEVFVGLPAGLAIFGLLGTSPPPPPPSSLQISAGGPATGTWVADEDFSGGATAATANAITTTGVTNPAPQSVYQHNRYGNFTYSVAGYTAGATYTIRLHFAEEYWTTAGSRTFNVLIDGTQVLTGFDILATAGGEYKAVVEQFTETVPSSGTFTIQFVSVKDNAQVNGIEILSSSGPPPPPPSSLQISAGGPATGTWVADEDFSGGATAATANAITTTGVTNPAPQSVYQHNRYGNFTYTIAGLTAGHTYTIRLHFAEEYWTTAGSRTFNVLIDGTQVLTGFDILATAGGEYKAVVEQFTQAAPSNGTITIQFVTVKDNAQVNGIEVLS